MISLIFASMFSVPWTLYIFVLTPVFGLLSCSLLSYFLKVYVVRAVLRLISNRACHGSQILLLLLLFLFRFRFYSFFSLCQWLTFVSCGVSERWLR